MKFRQWVKPFDAETRVLENIVMKPSPMLRPLSFPLPPALLPAQPVVGIDWCSGSDETLWFGGRRSGKQHDIAAQLVERYPAQRWGRPLEWREVIHEPLEPPAFGPLTWEEQQAQDRYYRQLADAMDRQLRAYGEALMRAAFSRTEPECP